MIGSEGIWSKKFISSLIILNRTSLILSYIFLVLLFISTLYLIFNFKNILRENPLIVYFLGLFFSGILFLIFFTIFEYYGEKNTTYKWEYINFLTMGTGYMISYFFLKKIKNIKLKYFNTLLIIIFIIVAQFQLLQFRYLEIF